MITTQCNSYSTNNDVKLTSENHHFVPACIPPKIDEITSLYKFLQGSKKLAILTGAGISTESGIPDYRSPNGAYSKGFKPITHQEFLRSERNRKRYWARSYVGWKRFAFAQPGPTHKAIAQLESRGYVENIITQNVDRLHHRAGSNPLELHGTTHEVVCMDCGDVICRQEFQDRIKATNPEWATAVDASENSEEIQNVGIRQRPDGDVEIDESFWEGRFNVPNCQICNGMLKPNVSLVHGSTVELPPVIGTHFRIVLFDGVVLFGDNLPKSRAERSLSMIDSADGVLVVGSSLMVLSAFRLAKKAYEKGIPLVIINIGVTRADELASLKIESCSGEILSRVLEFGT